MNISTTTPPQSHALSKRMNFSESGKKVHDPYISSWMVMLSKTEDHTSNTIDTDKFSAVENEIKEGILSNLRNMLKELDSTAWMFHQ